MYYSGPEHEEIRRHRHGYYYIPETTSKGPPLLQALKQNEGCDRRRDTEVSISQAFRLGAQVFRRESESGEVLINDS